MKVAITTLCSVLMIVLGTVSLSQATDSFTTWTAEQARRTQVQMDQTGLPNVELLSNKNTNLLLTDRAKPLTVINFIYTRCPTVCNNFGFTFKRLQQALADKSLTEHVKMLSISFDVSHDTAEALDRYLLLHGADTNVWHAAVPKEEGALNTLLKRFGVIVIDDKQGEFIHNSAIYITSANGIERIFDDNKVTETVDFLLNRLNSYANFVSDTQ